MSNGAEEVAPIEDKSTVTFTIWEFLWMTFASITLAAMILAVLYSAELPQNDVFALIGRMLVITCLVFITAPLVITLVGLPEEGQPR